MAEMMMEEQDRSFGFLKASSFLGFGYGVFGESLMKMMNSEGEREKPPNLINVDDIETSGFLAQDSLRSWPGSAERPGSKRSESLTRVTFRHPFLTEFYFLCKATVMSSNMLVHEPASRFRRALRLPRRSFAESATFEASRVHLGSTPVHLGDPVQWVNQPMVHLVNRS
ncbi:hypothetical protein PIB30_060091 [Stylosanthes scabra]|uniref:Uncharacterized protein n=1 Tax=Stylosanthes scabra TaxID=79078 RepID=A0ABU6YJC3_9FABA|nr:hypothetical protein [Stylosanthes scabra]